MNRFFLLISLSILTVFSVTLKAQNDDLKNWPKKADPKKVGLLVANRFIASPHNSFRPPAPPKSITYPETCTWYGALKFAEVTKNKKLLGQLEQRFLPFFGEEAHLVPKPAHVDATVFGTIPFELYILNKDRKYLNMGLTLADGQWTMPINAPEDKRQTYQDLLDKNLTWQTRYWIDDMYMITMVQSQAYHATGDKKYINRAANEMVVYLDTIQKPNGLFYHSPDAPYFWGRGNGWMAAGMSELLQSLDKDNKDRASIMASYLKMMKSLKNYQREDGLWGQLIDKSESWIETSGSAMFTFAMITGVKNGWLDKEEYAPVARKAWIALVDYIDADGNISEVCEGTNRKDDYQYYLGRKRIKGDMHGQAAVLWCTWALLK